MSATSGSRMFRLTTVAKAMAVEMAAAHRF
jgi:hypothetical protein